MYGRARQGMFWGLAALGIGAGDEVLMPAYHHGSEVEATLRSGARPRFYLGDEGLAPREAELEKLIGPRVRALHLIHYLGFPQDLRRWRRWCDEHGLALIEDAAQAWLSSRDGVPAGALGDLSFFSVYKTVGVHDGGAAICRAPLHRPRRHAPAGAAGLLRRQGRWLSQRSGLAAAVVNQLTQGRPDGFDAAEEFALGDTELPASRLTRRLAPRLASSDVAARRRANYRSLLEVLNGHVPAPFDSLQDGACPWIFPVTSVNKAALLNVLAARGIRALDLWSVAHPALPKDRFATLVRRRETTVGLPVHQGLRRLDLERVISTAQAALSGPLWSNGLSKRSIFCPGRSPPPSSHGR